MTSTQERAIVSARAKHLLAHLAEHPNTTLTQLGNARDLLNRVQSWPPDASREAMHGLEDIVTDVYGRVPDCECAN